MARVDVYVPEEQLADARYVLLADEVDATLGAPTEWWNAGAPKRRRRWPGLVALVVLACAVLAPIAALARGWAD